MLTSGIASFSLISTGVLCIVRPIAMILLFFSMAYPVHMNKGVSPTGVHLMLMLHRTTKLPDTNNSMG